jgi:hypothetical protein
MFRGTGTIFQAHPHANFWTLRNFRNHLDGSLCTPLISKIRLFRKAKMFFNLQLSNSKPCFHQEQYHCSRMQISCSNCYSTNQYLLSTERVKICIYYTCTLATAMVTDYSRIAHLITLSLWRPSFSWLTLSVPQLWSPHGTTLYYQKV